MWGWTTRHLGILPNTSGMLPNGDIYKLPIGDKSSELVKLADSKYQESESERGQVGPQIRGLVDVVHQAVFGVACSPPCSFF